MDGLILLGAANPSAPPDDDKFLGVPKWLILSLGAPLAVFGILWAKGRFDAWLLHGGEREREANEALRKAESAKAEQTLKPYYTRLEEGAKAAGGGELGSRLASTREREAAVLLARVPSMTDVNERRRLLYNYAREANEAGETAFPDAATMWKWAKAQEVIHRGGEFVRPRYLPAYGLYDNAFINYYILTKVQGKR